MGLDMYLNRRCVCGKADTEKIRQMRWGLPFSVRDKMGDWSELVYWRKANMIHNWFVKNVQNGKDDCGEYPVTRDNIVQLFELCIKAAHAIQKGKFVLYYQGKPKKEDEPWDRPTHRVPAKLCKPVPANGFIKITNVKSEDEKSEVNEYSLDTEALDAVGTEYEKAMDEEMAKAPKFWVLDNATQKKLDEILPTADGFFFGSTLYGQYYIEDIFDTIVKLRKAIYEIDQGEAETQAGLKYAEQAAKGDPRKLARLMKNVPRFSYSYCASW
jgi:hypothetical protein